VNRVVIGAVPHKLPVTIETRDNRELLRATGRFATDGRSYRQLLEVARQWPERIWAVEGANGIGRPLTQRLLASGERVLDVPAKLAARARVFDTGQGRKTDATDAHAIVMVALRDKGLREVSTDPELMMLRMLRMLRPPRRAVPRPGAGAQPDAPAVPRAAARRGAGEEIRPPVPGNAGHSPAARPRGEDPPPDGRGGTGGPAPPGHQAQGDESRAQSGGPRDWLALDGHPRHRPGRCREDPRRRRRRRPVPRPQPLRVLDRHRPDRRVQRPAHPPPAVARREPPPGHVLYTAGIVQLRNDTAGRAYYRRKLAAGKTSMEAMRCLRRRLSDAVYRQLVTDAQVQEEASPGGHPGASLESSAAGLSPDTGTSDQPLPGPAPQTLPPPRPAPQPMAPAAAAIRRRARGVNVERPTGRTTLTPTSAATPSTAPGPCP
jgi:transposase